jgi:predicted amidohydrolase
MVSCEISAAAGRSSCGDASGGNRLPRCPATSTPLTATLDDAVPAAIAAVEEAGRLGARILCLPETGLPGHRLQQRPVPEVSQLQLDAAIDRVAAVAAHAGVVTILGVERPTPAGRQIVAVVLGADGTRLGEQVKTQVAPEEEPTYVAGSGRRTFTAAGITFGIAICHEAFRYPEIVRGAVLAGAQVIFVPHFLTHPGVRVPDRWCDASSSYHEKALMCRALENTVFIAMANVSGDDQGSATGVIAPDGSLIAQLPYGRTGVLAVDLDLTLADALLARRWSPDRSVHQAVP